MNSNPSLSRTMHSNMKWSRGGGALSSHGGGSQGALNYFFFFTTNAKLMKLRAASQCREKVVPPFPPMLMQSE